MKRTPLKKRQLPRYSTGEEIANTATHIIGVLFAICVLVLCCIKASTVYATVSSCIYGISMLLVYSFSSIYHGVKSGTGKKVLQVLDHCLIYFLIAGTYTPILLCAFIPVHPEIGWGVLAAQWGLCTIAVTLTAIDLRKFREFSMVCYILMGWGIIFFSQQAVAVLSIGFCWILLGGIVYTAGAIVYGIGAKKPWFHSIFHIFVLGGSFLQFMGIYLYVL